MEINDESVLFLEIRTLKAQTKMKRSCQYRLQKNEAGAEEQAQGAGDHEEEVVVEVGEEADPHLLQPLLRVHQVEVVLNQRIAKIQLIAILCYPIEKRPKLVKNKLASKLFLLKN